MHCNLLFALRRRVLVPALYYKPCTIVCRKEKVVKEKVVLLELLAAIPTVDALDSRDMTSLGDDEEDGSGTKCANQEVKGEDGNEIRGSSPDENGDDGGDSGGPAAASASSNNQKPAKESVPMVSFPRLFSFADKYDFVLMFFGSIGAGAHGCAMPVCTFFFGKLIDGLGSDGSVDRYVLRFVWTGVASLVAAWMEVAFWMQSGERQASNMRAEYLQALLRQDVAYFDTDAKTGEFISSIASDPLVVQDAISEKMGNFIHFVSTFISGFVVSFTTEWRIALLTLATVPVISTAGVFYFYAFTGVTASATASYSDAASIAEQAMSQIRTVYSFSSEKKCLEAYSKALAKTVRLETKGGLAKGLGLGVVYSSMLCGWALLIWYGGKLVRNGTVPGGTALATVLIVIISSMALGQALPNLGAFAKGRAAAFKILQMMEREPVISKPNKSGQRLASVQGTIELRNVHFAYPSRPDAPIFRNFSLSIPAGKNIAIVGASGSGKSTVVSLIERFYDPIAGEVLLDGHNLKMLDLRWLRTQIGLVNQEPALFATTIAANILYGKAVATQKEIADAANAANAHSFIEQLPLGYQTQVGEKGVQLSGGQKQRVAIARAVVKNPRVLLLDEATSALDAGSEQVVQEALDRLMVGRTTAVVAHRLSTVRNADSIAVVQQGRLVEMGTHDNLIAREDGVYSSLVRLQEMAGDTEGAGARVSRTNSTSSFRGISEERRLSRGHSRSRSRSRSRSGSGSESAKLHDSSRWAADSSETSEGMAPLEEPQEKKRVEQVSKGSLTRLVGIARPDWKYGLAGVIGSVLAGCMSPGYAYLLAAVLDAYFSKSNSHVKSEVAKLSLILAALGVFAPFVYTLQHYSLGVFSARLVKRVRQRMFATILLNEMGWFDEDANNSSQIAARLASDATNVRAAVGDRASVMMQTSTMLLIAFIISLIIEWRMALVMICSFPLITGSSFCDSLFLQGFAGDQARAFARASRVAGEAVINFRTVAAFNAEDKVEELFLDELKDPAKRTFWRGQVAGIGYGFSQFVLFSTYGMSLWYAGRQISSGQGTFGEVVKVYFLIVMCSVGAAEALTLSPDLVRGRQAVESVFRVLDRKTQIEPEDPRAREAAEIRGDIELRDIEFAYPSRPDVLVFQNLSLKVPSGRSLALVGASGSGKSSVVALIERFYDPLSGHVLIDGTDIRKYNLKSVRRHIALVQQEPALFGTTVYENILYGKEEASESEVIEAAKKAQVHELFSSLPDGYRTRVGERGVQLSGGQKQRVAIARAVLKDPSILLLDEATSALDAESESVVQEALDKLMAGRTTIVVAHRLSTIRGANSIAVVQGGSILEEGSHENLLSRAGAYSRLVNLKNPAREEAQAASSEKRDGCLEQSREDNR